MLRLTLALTGLLALLSLPAARAADLDLVVSADGIGPTAFTLRDVRPGTLPSVELPGADGSSMRVDLKLAESTMEGDPAYDLTLTLTRSALKGRKTVQRVVGQPTLRFRPDQPAEVFMGGQRPIPGAEPGQMEPVNFIRVNARIHAGASGGL